MDNDHILEIKNLTLSSGEKLLTDQASLHLRRGKTTGLVGESGSGKTLTALSVLQLLPPGIVMKSGEIRFNGRNATAVMLNHIPVKELNRIRGGKISMIFQEPMTCLNPSMTCGRQIMEMVLRHKRTGRKQAALETLKFINEVRLPDPERIFNAWPHQLSGGQRQRVMIAMALSAQPELLIADEPTTALDVTVQKNILELLNELRGKYNLTVLFITHDLMILKQIADDIAVMYRGQIIESGPAEQILNRPEQWYTRALIACKPKLEGAPERLPTVADFTENTGQSVKEPRKKLSIQTKDPILSVRDLSTWFQIKGRSGSVKAVDRVSFDVYEGETLGLVGESGSGKTTLGRTILKLIKAGSGEIIYRGMNLNLLSKRELRAIRKKIQVVFQDPYSSLNPRFTVRKLVTEPMEIHGIGNSGEERNGLAIKLLEQVGLDEDALDKYPHQFSGGQRQRIGIARALACRPEFIILDESVSALDVSIQAQILNLLNDLKLAHRLTYIFISHDLTVVKYMSDRVMIMKNGEIIESGSSEKIYLNPVQAYTRDLIGAIPR